MSTLTPARAARRYSAALVATVLPLIFVLGGLTPRTAYAAMRCSSGVDHDVNGDGYAEVAIFELTPERSGAVHVFYGSATGLLTDPTSQTPDDQYFRPDTPGIPGSAADAGYFGGALAFGDYNADGCADLAIGAALYAAVPRVTVLSGSPRGLTTSGVRSYTDDDIGLAGTTTHLGNALVAADLDDDGVEDLAIGADGAEIDGQQAAGAVAVVGGSATGLALAPTVVLTRNTAGIPGVAGYGEAFGESLAAGDFDGDGVAELAISAPFGRTGLVQTVERGPDGYGRPQPEPITLKSPGLPRLRETYSEFGVVTAAGDVDADGRSDLAIGAFQVPCRHPDDEECDYSPGNGTVLVFPGTDSGLSASKAIAWTQDSPGVAGSGSYERFGSSLAMGRLDDGPTDDLAIGASNDKIGKVRAGSVTILLGSPHGLTTVAAGGSRIHQGVDGISGSNESGDGFGSSLQIANVQGRTRSNLVIGSVGEAVGRTYGAGEIHQLASGVTGPKAQGSRALNAGSSGVRGPLTRDGYFGLTLG